jgi:hypothetical protein
MHTHPITKEIAAWWEAYGSNTSSAEWQLYVKHLSELVGVKCSEISEAHSNKGKSGMSGAGGCTRRPVLKMLGLPEEPHSGDTLVTFHIGHLLESIPIATLRAMGYTVEGTQEPVMVGDYMMSYTDGMITAGPRDDIAYPLPLSVKTAGYKMAYFSKDAKKIRRNGFAALGFEGVRMGHPTWYAQSQMEMLATGAKETLVVVVAKDIIQAFKDDEFMQSLSFYAELIKADEQQQKYISGTWKRTWEIASDPSGIDDVDHVPAYYYVNGKFIEIPEPGSKGGEKPRGFSMWAGPNQEAGLPFNVCATCGFRNVCQPE